MFNFFKSGRRSTTVFFSNKENIESWKTSKSQILRSKWAKWAKKISDGKTLCTKYESKHDIN